MNVDERSRLAARLVTERVERLDVPDFARVLRRRRRHAVIERGVIAAVVVAAIVAGVTVVLPDDTSRRVTTTGTVTAPPPGTLTSGRWSQVPVAASGLPAGASLDSLVSTGDALLVAGGAPDGGQWRSAIWRSTDGLHWSEAAAVPSRSGEVHAVAVDGQTVLAIGSAPAGVSNFVWRSMDDGRTWTPVMSGEGLFGTPAPQMGRPFVDGLVRAQGQWVAFGGRADGYAAVWVSPDGARWREVLGDNGAGSVAVVRGASRSLFAYWVRTRWFTHRVTRWGQPQPVSLPGRLYLQSVAPDAAVAFGANLDRDGVPTPLLRSADHGHTWSVDPGFLTVFPGAVVQTVHRTGAVWVATGTSGSPNHPDAWISRDGHRWSALPHSLYGAPGGILSLAAVVHGRAVLMGGAPELDRYYVMRL
jgi:hypothetical protein